jgi:hypothetical protein
MFCRRLPLPLAILLVLAEGSLWAADPLPPAEQWLPEDAALVLKVSQPKDLFELVLSPKVSRAVTASPPYQKFAASPQAKGLFQGVRFLEAAVGTDWPTAIRKLAAQAVTVGVCPQGTVIVIVDGEDPALLSRLHEVFVAIARGEAEKQGNPGRVASTEYRGVTGWTFNGQEAHAILGSRFILSNRREGLDQVLDRRAEPQRSTAASLAAYGKALKAAGGDTAGAFVNMELLREHPLIQQVLQSNGNPLAVLLFRGIQETVGQSTWIGTGLGVQGKMLSLRMVTDAKVTSAKAAFARPEEEEGVLPNLSVPRRLAALSLYRDLHRFYATKDELFPERTSGLIFFENMMGIFFSGRDLTDEVLSQVKPEIRLVVAQQQYDPAVGTPATRIPGFAAVLRLRDPKQFAPVAEEAWQKALGLINFTRGQQGQPGMILDRPDYHGTKYTVAYFSTAGADKKTALETRFNFRPALAQFGDYLVLSSTEQLAQDVLASLELETAKQPKLAVGTDSLLDVDGTGLAAVVRASRDEMVRQNMIEKGHSQEQAEAEIDVLEMLLGYLGKADVKIGSHDGLTEANVQLNLNIP